MAIWQFSCMVVPSGQENNNFTEEKLISWDGVELASSISDSIDKILPINKSWSNHIHQYGKNDNTCIELIYDDRKIQEISCRLDLRDLSKKLLIEIIEYINKLNGMIFYKGNIYPAEIATIIELMKQSEAAKFCNNPPSFFNDLN